MATKDPPPAGVEKARLPAAITHQIRNVLAVHCREMVMECGAAGMKEKAQDELAYKVFHGSKGYASVLDMFLEGKGPYASMFETVDLVNNQSSNENRSQPYALELKQLFHCNNGTLTVLFT